MSKLALPLFLTLLVFWLIGATWWFNSRYDQLDDYDESKCTVPFILIDGNFQTKSEKTIIFEISDWEPIIPMQTLASLKSVALYLTTNNNKTLTLTGWFGKNEINNSDFPNIGLARAEAIKNELVTYGVPTNNVKILSDSMDQILLTCGKIMGGVDFRFSEILASLDSPSSSDSNNQEAVAAVAEEKEAPTPKVERSFDPRKTYMVFYEENTFKPEITEHIDAYFSTLAKYLADHPKDRILLMGHTDNSGKKDKHFNFGKYRARKLRDVLLDYGIAKRRIKTDSEGSSKPLESNKTKAGRYKNRRVEISIIQR
ncbi:MAG: OmpA family protein [Bacteroidota bacterium]